jgi:hypothetical protein
MQVRYFDEFKWVDAGEGTVFHFQDETGESVADVAIHDPDLKLWKWEVRVPQRYQFMGVKPCGLVVGVLAAKRVCELILSSTFITRPAVVGPASLPRLK